MQDKRIIFDSSPFLQRAFFLEEQKLISIKLIKPALPKVGNIYKGKISRIVHSLKVIFVDIGLKEQVTIKFKQIVFDLQNQQAFAIDKKGCPKCSSGQVIYVQITQLPVGNKGYVGTTAFLLVGRYCVLQFGVKKTGIFLSSRCPDNEVVQSLKLLAQSLLKKSLANVFIIRSNACYVDSAVLQQECKILQQWILDKVANDFKLSASRLVYEAPSLEQIILQEMEKSFFIQTNSMEGVKRIAELINKYPDLTEKNIINERIESTQIEYLEDQLLTLLQPVMLLSSGGNLVIEQTQAMTVIDVNTAMSLQVFGKKEDINFNTNLEACHAISQQIMLRNISGLIVIDFINTRDCEQKKIIRNRLIKAMQQDKNQVRIGYFSNFGILEMTRSKRDLPVLDYLQTNCSLCLTPYAQGKHNSVLHTIYLEIENFLIKKMIINICVIYMSRDLYDYCWTQQEHTIQAFNKLIKRKIEISIDDSYLINQYSIKVS